MKDLAHSLLPDRSSSKRLLDASHLHPYCPEAPTSSRGDYLETDWLKSINWHNCELQTRSSRSRDFGYDHFRPGASNCCLDLHPFIVVRCPFMFI